jgi:hypothetical protein
MTAAALALVGLALVLLAAGSGLLELLTPAPARRGSPVVMAAIAGMVAMFAVLQVASQLGVAWRVRNLGLVAAGLLALWFVSRLRPLGVAPAVDPEAQARASWGWGDALAALALGAFLGPAVLGWVTTPDFIYHWGVKGARFALAGGIDYGFLAAAQNWAVHPDYPLLLPTLFAVVTRVAGRFEPSILALLTGLAHVLVVLAARAALLATAASRASVQLGTALVAVVTSMVALGNLLAGGADVLMALALLAAWPLLARRPAAMPEPSGGGFAWQLGLIAALAAAAKIEGVVLAGFLLLAGAWRLLSGEAGKNRRQQAVCLAALALPTLLVSVPWWWAVRHHGLFQPSNTGTFDLGHVSAVLPAIGEVLAMRHFRGFAWLPLVVPALFAVPAVRRPLALVLAVASAQLVFDLYVYLAASVDAAFWVLTSFPRLLFQLLPTALVLAVVAVSGEAEEVSPSCAADP